MSANESHVNGNVPNVIMIIERRNGTILLCCIKRRNVLVIVWGDCFCRTVTFKRSLLKRFALSDSGNVEFHFVATFRRLLPFWGAGGAGMRVFQKFLLAGAHWRFFIFNADRHVNLWFMQEWTIIQFIVKKQVDVSFSCACPVIDNNFRHTIVPISS